MKFIKLMILLLCTAKLVAAENTTASAQTINTTDQKDLSDIVIYNKKRAQGVCVLMQLQIEARMKENPFGIIDTDFILGCFPRANTLMNAIVKRDKQINPCCRSPYEEDDTKQTDRDAWILEYDAQSYRLEIGKK